MLFQLSMDKINNNRFKTRQEHRVMSQGKIGHDDERNHVVNITKSSRYRAINSLKTQGWAQIEAGLNKALGSYIHNRFQRTRAVRWGVTATAHPPPAHQISFWKMHIIDSSS